MIMAAAGNAHADMTVARNPDRSTEQIPGLLDHALGRVAGPDQLGVAFISIMMGGGLKPPPRTYKRASNTMLNGVAVARRISRKPPAVMTSRSLASPACAPNAAPTSCERDVGTHTSVDAA
jgi:hypothetical protein